MSQVTHLTAEKENAVVINHPITGVSIKKPVEQPANAPAASTPAVCLDETLERPECLSGKTYKVKPPMQEKAFYVTINHIVLNVATENEQLRPFEVFVEGGNVEQSQWVSFATRAITAVFRKGGEFTFILDQMKQTMDPAGGYMLGRGRYANSIVAHIGFTIEDHLKSLGIIKDEVMTEAQSQVLAGKKAEYLEKTGEKVNDSGYPANATVCGKCHTKAVIMIDGCHTCLSCADSRCN